MAAPRSKPRFTVDQYLAIERTAEDRHVYLDGEIYAMAGENDAHGIISVNLVIALGSQFKGKPCQVRTKDTKVRSGPAPTPGRPMTGLYSYPDIVVICEDPQYHDEMTDVILNPRVILEVLSPTTEAFDRGQKFTRYQTWNPTLLEYVLVSQDQPQIEIFSRKPDGTWSYHRVTGLEQSVAIPSIECTLKLADVYDRVQFPQQ